MANVTDNPVANAAAEMFNSVVDSLKPQPNLSVSLPEMTTPIMQTGNSFTGSQAGVGVGKDKSIDGGRF